MKGVDVICEKRKRNTQPMLAKFKNRASLCGAPKTRAREKQDEILIKLGAGSFFTKP